MNDANGNQMQPNDVCFLPFGHFCLRGTSSRLQPHEIRGAQKCVEVPETVHISALYFSPTSPTPCCGCYQLSVVSSLCLARAKRRSWQGWQASLKVVRWVTGVQRRLSHKISQILTNSYRTVSYILVFHPCSSGNHKVDSRPFEQSGGM